jgi:single stranded DNA-binding protein
MKSIIIDGRIGANGAEVRQTKTGKSYMKISVANNTFSNGKRETDWYDVFTYDPHLIENLSKYLTKGTYVIVNGVPSEEVKIDKNGRVWLNRYINAYSINLGSSSNKEDNTSTSASSTELSTFTASTDTVISKPSVAPSVDESRVPQSYTPEPVPAGNGNYGYNNDYEMDDDLPF